MKKMQKLAPGLALCLFIGWAAGEAGRWVPSLGAGTISILSGILLGNTLLRQFRSAGLGTKFAESTLLYLAIALLGGTTSFPAIGAIGWAGLLFIILQMAAVLLMALWIGRKFGLPEDFTMLMAGGNAVCGSSAIAAIAPAIGADEKQKGLAVTLVNVTGTVLMLILPWAAGLMYHDQIWSSSALIGGILQSVGQVVAAGSMVSEDVKNQAALFKIVRILLLTAVIFILARLRKDQAKGQITRGMPSIPWYIIGFFLLCILCSLGWIPSLISAAMKETGNFLELTALAGIGLRVDIADLIRQGAKAGGYTLLLAAGQTLAALLLILLLF